MSELKLQQCRLDGRYDVQDCLGRGSYSEVYVARDMAASEGAPRTVVIKALNTSLQGAADPELERTLIENFRNEAVALDRVRHPNIISRLGHGTAIDLQGRTFHYLVLEYLPGGDLQARVRNRPVPLDGALFYIEQVCNGLAHAHKNGVIHRDIKPQNLLLTADQHVVKIADFGVAKIEAGEGAITRVGTDVYAAPEHHPLGTTAPLDTASLTRRVSMLTPAADIYSLAKTTYMILTGEAPRRFSQRPISELPTDYAAREWSRYVLTVLEKATQTNPEKRHQTVEEFWRDIKDATMAQTRPLRTGEGGDDDSSSRPGGDQSNSKPNGRGLATPPPPAPTFDRESRARDNTARHRIVVPIARAGVAASLAATPATAEFPAPHARESRPATRDTREPQYPTAYEPRLSSGARKWLVAFALLLAFSGMLFATYKYVNNMRRGPSGGQQTSSRGDTASQVGDIFVTTIDVNLRNGPGPSYARVGMAENGSRVKVLQANGKWYQVQVMEHARPKTDSNSRDQGWVNSTFLKAQ
jgi:serine/threonine protein kinase